MGRAPFEGVEARGSRLVRPDKGSELPGSLKLWVIPDASKGDGVVNTVAVRVDVLLTGVLL